MFKTEIIMVTYLILKTTITLVVFRLILINYLINKTLVKKESSAEFTCSVYVADLQYNLFVRLKSQQVTTTNLF